MTPAQRPWPRWDRQRSRDTRPALPALAPLVPPPAVLAFLVLAVAVLCQNPHAWGWALASIAAAALAFSRMVRFGERYGRELLVEFIGLMPKAAVADDEHAALPNHGSR